MGNGREFIHFSSPETNMASSINRKNFLVQIMRLTLTSAFNRVINLTNEDVIDSRIAKISDFPRSNKTSGLKLAEDSRKENYQI